MNNNAIVIMRKELARFFSNKVSALVSIALPGVLIFVLWSLMGGVMQETFSPDEEAHSVVAVVAVPESISALASEADIEIVSIDALPSQDEMREAIERSDVQAYVEFPEGFDAAVMAYDPATGMAAPQVSIYYNSTEPNSSGAFAALVALLDGYESSLANRFDVNAGESTYDVAQERDLAASVVMSLVPMMVLLFVFTSCMSLAAESIAGEKERGTMATLLATPVKRRDIALGKILAISAIGLLIAASSMIGTMASLPNLMQTTINMNVYTFVDYALLMVVVLPMTLLTVMVILVVSALARSTKEASLFLTPIMIVVMVVGIVGMIGGAAQTEAAYYLIPLYNSVQSMIAIFTFDFQPANIALCVASNLIYTGIGVVVLQRMFNSERLMFAR